MLNENDELTVGSPAPDFRLQASTGGEIGLADYQDGHHVVLFFVREFI